MTERVACWTGYPLTELRSSTVHLVQLNGVISQGVAYVY
jgi:hypothetical protein